ncbi:hypothetical protein jhhlp_004642 [Lomentospora prolificans]|uniref:Zn(2)-C6 fungal-type domain-containing protein n=1 Tax=Lomentospora prolificans TaxID=41688 RepID=A0A2N3NC89_9PEZI|nr:hypothetical protein jhhlp_004642 [Lomentospora prolificans]
MEQFSPSAPSSSSPSPITPARPHTNALGTATAASSTSRSETRTQQSTVAAACLACRAKHLKCDGSSPCARCKSSNYECVYVASRRGYKPKKNQTSSRDRPTRQNSLTSLDAAAISPDDEAMILGSSTPVESQFHPPLAVPDAAAATPYGTNVQLSRPFHDSGASGVGLANSISDSAPLVEAVSAQAQHKSVADNCLESFYHNFYPAHPFVLPAGALPRTAKDLGLKPLLAAIRWIGSLYIDVGQWKASFLHEALRLAYDLATPRDGFLLQTLLLLIIGLDGNCQQEKARQLLSDAETLALQLGINSKTYATLQGRGIPVLEESWRRTWWELYVVDALIAGVHRNTNFFLFDFPAETALPCEEHQYVLGNIPPPTYLEDLDNKEFSGDDRQFSSFAYRILAARNLGKLLRATNVYGGSPESVERIENLLTNWRVHLPDAKRDALNNDCKVDEMMFQAHMITHAAVPGGPAFNLHTQHTLSSAADISRLITHRAPILSHTHFFICAVSLSSIVHLSRWAQWLHGPQDDDDLRQMIRLNIGALNRLGQVWGAADMAAGQVRGVAQEIYQEKKARQVEPSYWAGLTQGEVVSAMATDETIMSEIDGSQNISGPMT